MKLLILFFLFINLASAAEVVECELVISEEAVELAETFDPKNCLIGATPRELTKAFSNVKDRTSVCEKCVSPLLKDNQKSKIPNEKYKSQFIKASINELKKGLSQTMLELMPLRSNIELGIDGDAIAKSCKIDEISNFPACQKIPNLKAEIKEIQTSLANEFARFYNDKITAPGLMDRIPNNACSIQDKDLITIKNQYLESSLPQIISVLGSISVDYSNPTFMTEFNDKLSKEKNVNSTTADILAHPLLGPMLRDPVALKTYLDGTRKSQSFHEMRSRLYNKEGTAAFSANLIQKCEGFKKTFKDKICGEEVAASNFSTETKNELEIVTDAPTHLTPQYFETTKNSVIEYCQDQKYKDSKTVTFTSIQEALAKGIPEKYKDLKYSAYKSEMYKEQVENQRDLLCKIDDGSATCEKGSQLCSLYEFWKKAQDPESTNFKLLGAHDPNIDKILRALIGNPQGLSDDTTKVLVKQGIYPDPITQKYAESDIPERKADYYKTEFAAQAGTLASSSEVQNAKIDKKFSSPKPDTKVVSYATDKTPPTPPADYVNPSVEGEQSIRDDLQRKILDRLDNQLSAKQIEAMVAKAYNKGRETPLTPQQVTAKTKELLEEIPSDLGSSNGSTGTTQGGKASVARDTVKEKKAAQQLSFLKAKYGIDPNAPKGPAGKAGTSSDENLQVVAINGAAELKIVVDDIKNLKGQEIAKLIESETPFILKIGKISYKVSFADNKVKITTPEGMIRNPAAITKLEEYIASLAERQAGDPLSKNENRKLYKNLQKVKYN